MEKEGLLKEMDEKEVKRIGDGNMDKMERIVKEMIGTEKQFLKSLNLVYELPAYLKNSKSNEKSMKVVDSISRNLEPVIKTHNSMFADLEPLASTWNSRNPNLSKVILQHSENLSSCIAFVMVKQQLGDDFETSLKRDSKFAKAVKNFEKNFMNGISVDQQLKAVHQNVFHYQDFMKRYQNCLDPSFEEEINSTKTTVEKLGAVLTSLNSNIERAELATYRLQHIQKFRNIGFDITKAGRNLLKFGIISRQARSKMVERNLILFSDVIVIVHLNYKELDKFDLDEMKIEDDDDDIRCFKLFAPHRSIKIICISKSERNSWAERIRKAQSEFRLSLETRPESLDEDVAVYSGLWFADKEASMCMIFDCAREFNILDRRHHCRKCGYIICGSCSGRALLPNGDYKSSRVCPVCYDELFEALQNGTMKWPSNVETANSRYIRFMDGTQRSTSKLFEAPSSGKKIRGDNYSDKDKYLVTGPVDAKNNVRYARLTNDFHLYFYAGQFDPKPANQFYVEGFSFMATADPKKENIFQCKLVQKNGTENNEIHFQVHSKFVSIWQNAFNDFEMIES